jgi:hypothetical protein
MNAKKILAKIVGVTQTTIGCLIMLFAFFVFYNIFNIQATFGFAEDAIGLYLWAFILFGLLSVISGLFLVYESS